MVTYNPKDWVKLIIHFHKSDTLRILLPAILLLGAITGGVSFLEQKYLKDSLPANLTIFHQISGFILSLVLVFRINSAYDRWWEGRKLWGSLLNSSRNLALKLNAIIATNDTETRKNIQLLISNYGLSLKEHLRGNSASDILEYSANFRKENYLAVNHRPNYIASLLVASIYEHCKKNQNDYTIVNLNINDFTVICGGCERIKNTPIPYAFSIFIKKIVFIYVITMPISFGLSMGYWSVPIVMIMFYAFASLELISEEIEDPFGTDANDLPIDDIVEKIKVNTREILLA